MTENRSRRIFNLKIAGLCLLSLAGIIWLACEMFNIQILDSEFYRKKVASQLTAAGTIEAQRGLIYDSNGEELAVNRTKYRIFISPQDIIDKMAEEEEEGNARGQKLDEFIAEELSELTGVSSASILELAKKSGRRDETVVKSADRETADKVLAFASENGLEKMIYASAFSERYYIYGNLASAVLGFTGTSGDGLYGLELYYNSLLSGTDGSYTMATDPSGNIIADGYENTVDATDGNNLSLTLDRYIQTVLEEEVKAACDDSGALNGGCGIVMNVKTGAILAMATYPDYDSNSPRTLTGSYLEELTSSGYAEDSAEYLALLGELQLEMWQNKAVSYSYVPGSTFKVITAGMALESGVMTSSATYKCTGSYTAKDGTVIHCSNLYGHGELTFAQGLQQSCNPAFINAGTKIGTSKFYSYFKNFGYLTKSGIDLPSEGETVFWSEDAFSEMDLITGSFGQNFKVTPIRHLCCLAAVANGGTLVEPYLVETVTDADGNTVSEHSTVTVRQVLSRSTSALISQILAEGVAGNGGSRNAYVAGYRVAAKTGTSEKIGDDEENKICSCVAYAPYDDPEIIMLIMVDSPTEGVIYGSTVAAPYVAESLSKILPYLGVEAVYTEQEAARLSVSIDDYTGTVPLASKTKIEALGLICETVGTGTVVTAQVPAAGTSLSKESGRVVLYLGDSAPDYSVKIPQLTGLTAVEARQALINAGLNVSISGSTNYESAAGAVVIGQSLSVGTLARRGDVVTLTVRYTDISDD